MKLILITLILLIAISGFALPNWVTKFDDNSDLHMGCCGVITGIGHILSKAYITENRYWNSAIGATFAMAVGVKKEYDDVGSFDFNGDNYRDLRDDFIGVVLGVVVMQMIEPFEVEFFDGHYFLTLTIYL